MPKTKIAVAIKTDYRQVNCKAKKNKKVEKNVKLN